jgi:hypothetical protein
MNKKKAAATIALLGVLTVFSFGGSSAAEPLSVIETALPASNVSPLITLDLYPTPIKAQPDRDFLSMNLDPQAAARSTISPSFRPAIRIFKAGDTLFDLSLVTMVALNVADYLSTKECLKYPGLSEGNPLMKPFVKDPYVFAAAKIAMTAFTYWNMKSLCKKSKPLAWVASLAANMALGYVVSNNYRLLGRAKAIACAR